MTSSFDASFEMQARSAAFVAADDLNGGTRNGGEFEPEPWFGNERWARSGGPGASTRWPQRTELAEEAYAAGRAGGRAELPWREAERLEEAATAFERGLQELTSLRRNYLMNERAGLIELAIAIAEKLVRRRVETDADALAGLIERALGSFEAGESLCLKLSERDYEVFETGASGGPLGPRFEAYALRVEPDPELDSGDARVIAEKGEVDARLAALLEQVREALQPLLASEEDAG